MSELQYTFRSLMALLLVLAMLAATAYTVGLIQHFFREKMEAEVYGLSKLYADEPDPTMPIFFWQGKNAADVSERAGGWSKTGDALGNSTSFSLRMLKTSVTVDSVDWTGYSEGKYMYPFYLTPTFTVENKAGGEIFVIYEYEGFGHLVYSSDVTRRPVEYDDFRQDDWFNFFTDIYEDTIPERFIYSRADVYTNRLAQITTDTLTHAAGNPNLPMEDIPVNKVVFQVAMNPFRDLYGDPRDGAGRPSVPDEAVDYAEYPHRISTVSFHDLYTDASAEMYGVHRYEVKSYLRIYAMDPVDRDEVLVSSIVQLTHYTPWTTANGYAKDDPLFDGWNQDTLTAQQKNILKAYDEPSHWGCRVTLTEYEEELRLVE